MSEDIGTIGSGLDLIDREELRKLLRRKIEQCDAMVMKSQKWEKIDKYLTGKDVYQKLLKEIEELPIVPPII